MDRNAPPALTDTARSGYDQSKALIRQMARSRPLSLCHHPALRGDQHAGAAGACRQPLARASRRVHANPYRREPRRDRLGEGGCFPQRRDYLDVYAHYGLIGRRAVLAHGVHLDESDFERCHASERRWRIVRPPTSFSAAACFRCATARDPRRPVHVGLGTDIGAGTSFSLLATMGEAYKVAQLQSRPISAIEAFFLATLGGARALALDDRLGTLAPGRDADMVVLDPKATPLLSFRNRRSRSIARDAGGAGDARRRPRGARDLCGGPARLCGRG